MSKLRDGGYTGAACLPYIIQSHDLVNIQAVAQGSYLHLNYKKREISIYFWVRLRHFLGQAPGLGQANSTRHAHVTSLEASA